MKKIATLILLLASVALQDCSDFLDGAANTSAQVISFDGGEFIKSAYDVSVIARDVFFVDRLTGFVVGDFGNIIKTGDSGLSWKKKGTGTTLPLVSVMFVDANTGFVAGLSMANCSEADCNKGSALLKTTDGGETWSTTFFKDYVGIFSLHFFDAQTGVAIVYQPGVDGRDYHFAKTTNGGSSWTFLNLAIGDVRDFQVVDDLIYVAGAEQQLFKSADGGDTWQTLSPPIPTSRELGGIYFYNEQLGFVDDAVQVYRTGDGGATWQALNTDFDVLGTAIQMWDENAGVNIVSLLSQGGAIVYVTTDGGLTWKATAASDIFYVSASSFPETDVGYGTNLSDFFTIRKM